MNDVKEGIGCSLMILSVGIAGMLYFRGCGESSVAAIERAKRQPELQVGDLNDNGIPDKFYTIDGKIAPVEVDGRPISEFYQK